MKRLFTLAIIAMIATISFAQAPMQKMGATPVLNELKVMKSERIRPEFKTTATSDKNMKKAASTVDIVCNSYSATYYEEDGDYYIAMISDDYTFYFDVLADELVLDKTYTLDDMVANYTVVMVNSIGSITAMTDAEFTLSEDNEGMKHVVATATTSTAVYNITYDETPKATYTYGEWTDFAPKGVATGTYTFDIMNVYSNVDLPVQVRTANEDANIKQIKVSNWGKGFLSANGVDFIINWNAGNNKCSVDTQETGYNHSSYGMVMVSDISAWQGMDYSSTFPCTYNPETATFSLSLNYRVSAGSFGYSGDSNGFTAETLVMDSPSTEPTGITHDIVITKNANWLDYSSSEGWFQLYTTHKEYSASISTANSTLNEGEFAKADLDAAYTYLGINGKKVAAADMHAKITNNEGVITGELWILDKESGDEYHVTMTYDPSQPVPLNYDEEDEVTYAFEVSEITQNSATGNSKRTITFTAKNATHQLALTMYASSKDAEIVIPEGEYTINSTKAAGTVLASTGVSSSGSVSRSYIGTIDEEGYLDQLWFMTGGTVKVKKVYPVGSDKAQVYMVINATNSWGSEVNVTVGEDGPTTAINNVNVVSEKTQKQLRNNQIVVVRNGVEYNAVGARLK